MKLLLLIMLATLSFASTQYKTPVFVVEKSILYCFYGPKSIIEEYKPGDLVSGNYAEYYCSYNYETIKKRQDKYIEEKNKDDKEFNPGFLIFVVLLAISIVAFLSKKEKE